MAAVAVLHDVNLAAAFATQVLLLAGGTALGHGPAGDVLVPERLQALYGVPMMAASGASGQLLFAPRVG
jgi:iron complex transport system ATP-binding protein